MNRSPGVPVLAVLLLLALPGCGLAGSDGPGDSAPAEPRTFANPVHEVNFPDAFVLRVDDT